MPLVSLGVGPSEIPPAVRADLAELAAGDLLSASHRGPRVKALLQEAVGALRRAMRVPEDFGVCFQPSATAGMELVLRNLVRRRAHHVVQGAFAERFAATGEALGLEVTRHELAWDAPTDPAAVAAPEGTELLAITHNETSTGRQWPWEAVADVRSRHPGALLALDVTSSFGGSAMDWAQGDVWFGSVQKCLGLPAGLGFVLAGPRALARAEALGAGRRVAPWQDLPALVAQLAGGQTPETPNVLAIALLGRQMARFDLDAVEAATRAKAARILEILPDETFYVREPAWRSLTTHCLRVADPAAWHARAEAAGFVLGAGYGPLKDTCVRIAAFPAVSESRILEALRAVGAV